MRPPPDMVPAHAEADGVGGTASPDRTANAACPDEEIVRCSPIGNCGEGATTADRANVDSPVVAHRSLHHGRGPDHSRRGTVIQARSDETHRQARVPGQSPEACARPSRREADVPGPVQSRAAEPRPRSDPLARSIAKRPVEASGITGGTKFEAIKLGRAGPFSLRSGAFRAAWALSWRLDQ